MVKLLNTLIPNRSDMKTSNKLSFIIVILVMSVEIFFLIRGKIGLKEGDLMILSVLALLCLLPEKQSRVLLSLISIFGIFNIFYYGTTSATPTLMEFTSGIISAAFLSDSRSILKFLIRGLPVYFYLLQIGLLIISFFKKR